MPLPVKKAERAIQTNVILKIKISEEGEEFPLPMVLLSCHIFHKTNLEDIWNKSIFYRDRQEFQIKKNHPNVRCDSQPYSNTELSELKE